MGFEKPKDYEKKEYKEKNYYNLTDKEQIFGIFPGLPGSNGVWHRFYAVHFGYKNSQGKLRTFLSTEEKNKKGMKEVGDAALDRLNDLKLRLEDAHKALKADPTNKALKESYETLFGLVGFKQGGPRPVYNLDKNHHMNVHDLNGNIGVLKLRHKAFLQLKTEIDRLKAEGTDALDEQNGRYFSMKRVGNGSDTSFVIKVYETTIEDPVHGKVKKELVRTITKDLEHRAIEGKEAFDLKNLFQKITPEEVQAIVDSSDLMTGNSPACDEIFDARWKANRSNQAQEQPKDEPTPAYTPAPTLAPTPVAAAQTQVAQEAKAAPKAAVKPKAPAFEELDNEAFFKAMGVPQKV